MNECNSDLAPTRRSLLSRLKNWDDQESWQDFFQTYWRLIYSSSLKAGLTEDEAQEVVQETIIYVCKKMREFKYDPERGSFKSWLLQVTRWRIVDQMRKRRPQEQRHENPEPGTRTSTIERLPDEAAQSLEDLWERDWEKNLVDAAVERVKRRVNPKHFQIFELYVLKEWPVAKVAKALGVNLAQVHLARYRIGKLVKREIVYLRSKLA